MRRVEKSLLVMMMLLVCMEFAMPISVDAKNKVKKTGIVLLQYPEGVDFGDEKAQLVIGIAGIGDEHLTLLGKITEVIGDEEQLNKLKTTNSVEEVLAMFK